MKGRRSIGVAAVLLFTLLTACDAPGPMWFWMRPESDLARILQDLFTQIVVLAVVVFIIVEGALLWAILRFRAGSSSHMPKQTHGNTRVEIAWTIAPTLVLVAIAVPTVRAVFETYNPPNVANPIRIVAVGHQWWWEFQYPDLNIITANEIVFPAGQQVNLEIKSADVIHAFWIPKLGGKRDAIPMRTNVLWWTADQPGVYYGQCTQLCGTSHANMRLRAIVKTDAEWQAWLSAMGAATGVPPSSAPENVQRGYQLVSTGACIGCHAIKGTSLAARVGPDLTRFGDRTTLGSGLYPNDDAHLIAWLRDPQGSKPGNKMPNLALTEEDAAAIAAYLHSLK